MYSTGWSIQGTVYLHLYGYLLHQCSLQEKETCMIGSAGIYKHTIQHVCKHHQRFMYSSSPSCTLCHLNGSNHAIKEKLEGLNPGTILFRNYQESSNLDQITTVMSDHNNLRVEIKIPKKKQKATMNKYKGMHLSLRQLQANYY